MHISNYKTPRIIYDRRTTGGTWPGSNLQNELFNRLLN